MANKPPGQSNRHEITFDHDKIPLFWEPLNERQLEQVRQIVREEIERALGIAQSKDDSKPTAAE